MITFVLLTFGMVVIGGLTRLTGSGLSIVEWKPITGILPPLNLQEWLAEFQRYQHTPEFIKINGSMTLPEFQSIFWLEYLHRLWGRLLGLVLLIPTFLILVKRQGLSLWPWLLGLWVLGAGQGLMGWLMVKSGLVLDPHVSPYRLGAHLLLGFAIFGVALWMTLSLYEEKGPSHRSLQVLTLCALTLVGGTAFWGAHVAGLKAGLVYNTFPLMEGRLVPDELFHQSPWWRDLLENPVSVQFVHRVLALSTTIWCLGIWGVYRGKTLPSLNRALDLVAVLVVMQGTLGVMTLLGGVPLGLALFHQGGAFFLFASLVYTLRLSSSGFVNLRV